METKELLGIIKDAATGLDHGYLINYGGDKFRIALKYRQYTPQ